jgi:predicted nucleic acid-binding protein
MEVSSSSTIVDTNVLVASFNEKDALHKRAVKAMDECPKPFILHEYILVETATVLMNRMDKQAANEFLHKALTNADTALMYSSEFAFTQAMKSFIANKTKQLSFVDSTLLDLSKRYSILTFDESLNRAIKKQKEPV